MNYLEIKEIDRQQVIKLEHALNKIKVNTLYLQLVEWHNEADKCLKQLLQLDNQADEFKQGKIYNRYLLVMKKISQFNLQIILLKK